MTMDTTKRFRDDIRKQNHEIRCRFRDFRHEEVRSYTWFDV